MTKSKRFKFTVWSIIGNFAIFTFGIYMASDLSALGAGLALINAPLYAYILGETMRPSGTSKTITKTKQQLND